MEYFDNNEQVQSRKYAFKCHRRSEAGRDLVYPVNAIAFHPVFGTFATGGKCTSVKVQTGTLFYLFICLHFGLFTVAHDGHSAAFAVLTVSILGSLQHLQNVLLGAAIMPDMQGN